MRTVDTIVTDVVQELTTAMGNYGPMASAHEGWAVLYEEVDELWDLVKVKQSKHNYEAMYEECIQVAAMALRFAHDICNRGKGP